MFKPHLFLSNNRCRDCDFPEEEHFSLDTASARGRAPTVEQKLQQLVSSECTHYTPHAWIVNKCRDCGRPESVHETSAGSVAEEDDEETATKPNKKKAVKHAPIRNLQEIAALGKEAERRSSGISNTAHAMQIKQRGKKKTAVAETDDNDDDEDDEDEDEETTDSLDYNQRVVDHAVAQMVQMEAELEDARAGEAAQLSANVITQEQYDANLAAIQDAYTKKEAELKAEVERARAEIEANRQREEQEEKKKAETDEEIARMREEAEKAKEEAAALRAEAAAVASRAEQSQRDADAARAEMERQRQEELEAVRAEMEKARLETEALKAEAAAQREENERREQERREAIAAAQAASQKAVEEVKEHDSQQVSGSPVIAPLVHPDPAVPAASDTLAAAKSQDDEAQPTAATTHSHAGPYQGTVNLSDVLLKVEKLFLSGKNFFRFCFTRPSVVISSVYLRVINDEYVLCWGKAGQRTVHQSRTLPFSQIKAIVVGRQSSVFRRPEFAAAMSGQCFSIIGQTHCLHLMAGNERDAEMTSFGLASLLKESRLTVDVFDHKQYKVSTHHALTPLSPCTSHSWQQSGQCAHSSSVAFVLRVQEPESAVMTETEQEQLEEDDSSAAADLTDLDQLISSSSAQRVAISLSVKCSSLPLVHQNSIVCLVDREEKTDRLVYISQTERQSKTNNPDWQKQFQLEYELGSVRELRFNVYDVAAKTHSIDDGDRIGSVRVNIAELVELDGVDYVFALTHADHNKNYKLIRAQATMTVRCTKKERVTAGQPQYSAARLSVDNVQLAALQSMLVKGDVFTSYTDNQPSLPLTLLYRVPAGGEKSFQLGELAWTVHGASSGSSGEQAVPLKSICDVYVGKKQRSFPTSAADECCFSLLSKTAVRLDLEARSRAQRDEYVNAITALLKHAAVEARKKAHEKLGTGRFASAV